MDKTPELAVCEDCGTPSPQSKIDNRILCCSCGAAAATELFRKDFDAEEMRKREEHHA